MVLKRKRGSFSALSHPILALAVLVIAISIGVNFTQSSLNFTNSTIGTLVDGDGDFVINNETVLSSSDRIVLSSAQSFVYAINNLAKGEQIVADLPSDYVNSQKVTHYQVEFYVELDGGEETIIKTEKLPVKNYIAFAKASEDVTDLDRVINMQLRVWYEGETSPKIVKTFPYEYDYQSDRGRTYTTVVSTSDPYEGDDLKTWDGPGADSDVDVDGDGIPGSKEACRDSPTVLEANGLNAFYCGKGKNFVKVQVYPCDNCDETNVRRGGQNWLQRVGSALFGDASDDVANSKDIFCNEGIMYPKDAPASEQVCIQCEPAKNTCYIKGFEFPQDVTKDTSFGTIAGQGDPTYLFYHQEFPVGAEQGWEMDKLSTFAYSQLATSVTLGVVGGTAGLFLSGTFKAVNSARKIITVPAAAIGKRALLLAKMGRIVKPSEFKALQSEMSNIRELSKSITPLTGEVAPQLRYADEVIGAVRNHKASFSSARDAVFLKNIRTQLDTINVDQLQSLSPPAKDELVDAFYVYSAKKGDNIGMLGPKEKELLKQALRESDNSDEFASILNDPSVFDGISLSLGAVGNSVYSSTKSSEQYVRLAQSFRDKYILTARDDTYIGATVNRVALRDSLSEQLNYIFTNVDPADLADITSRAARMTPPGDISLGSASLGTLADDATRASVQSSFDDVLAQSSVKNMLNRVSQYMPSKGAAATAAGVGGTYYTASAGLAILLLWEDSINDKYNNTGTNNMVLNTPSFYPVVSTIDDNEIYTFDEKVLQYPVLLDRDDRDQRDLERFMVASPCKADLIIEKVPCNCNAGLALMQKDGQQVNNDYELRKAPGSKENWIPTKGVDNSTGDKIMTPISFDVKKTSSYSPHGTGFNTVENIEYVLASSTGGNDDRATYQCTVEGELGQNIYDGKYAANTCVVVSLNKEEYGDYNGGYNYCHLRDPSGQYWKQGGIMALQLGFDIAITSLVGAACVGTGGIGCPAATMLGMAGFAVTSGSAYAGTNEVAENYRWPRGGN